MKYYRVYSSFTDYVPIDSTEMEKAMHAFITGNPVVLQNGALSRIDRIVPDYHREMGWNPAHRLDSDDYNELRSKGVEEKYVRSIGKAKEKVKYLMTTKQEHLIGQNVKIQELSRPPDHRLQNGMQLLNQKLKA